MSDVENLEMSIFGRHEAYYRERPLDAPRSLGLSARGRRPGAQQVPHYVHVHVHRPLPPTSYPLFMSARVHEARFVPRSLAQSCRPPRLSASSREASLRHCPSVARFLCFSLRHLGREEGRETGVTERERRERGGGGGGEGALLKERGRRERVTVLHRAHRRR